MHEKGKIKHLNITILGVGAMGSLWAYRLAEAGHNLSLWQRNPTSSSLSLTLDKREPLLFTTNDRNQLKKTELLIVTVKAWQVKEAISPLLKYLAPETIIVFMHNGMGAVDKLFTETQPHPIVLATTTQAAYKPASNDGKNSVYHTGQGTTTLGGFNESGDQCYFLTNVLNDAFPSVTWSDSIQQALWSKLAINCAINPLTALHHCTNGELLKPFYSTKLEQIVEEVCMVMNAEGIETSKQTLLHTVYHVASTTAENHSSMQQDIQYQRKTEIDYITGYLCHVAKHHNISVSKNLDLYNRIKQIEQSWSE